MSQVARDERQLHHSKGVRRELLEARRDSPRLLEPTDTPLNDVPASVRQSIEMMTSTLIGARWDYGSDVPGTQPGTNVRKAIALVASKSARTAAGPAVCAPDRDGLHDLYEALRLVRLPRRGGDGEGQSSAVNNQVELRGEPASRATQCVIGPSGVPPFRAPAAARLARIELPSTHQRSQSIRPS